MMDDDNSKEQRIAAAVDEILRDALVNEAIEDRRRRVAEFNREHLVNGDDPAACNIRLIAETMAEAVFDFVRPTKFDEAALVVQCVTSIMLVIDKSVPFGLPVHVFTAAGQIAADMLEKRASERGTSDSGT